MLAWRLAWQSMWPPVWQGWRLVVRYASAQTGLPALVIAALMLVIGLRLLRKSFRFAMEVAVIGFVLLAATELGWLRW